MENKIEIYKASDSKIQIAVNLERDTVWLNRQQLSVLFEKDIKTIGKHINNIFEEGELIEKAVVAKFATTATDGKTYQVEYYNLDMIISVGYRVNSKQGTQFRQWASQRLKEFLVEGYAINEKRLAEKQMQVETLKTGIRILCRAIEEKSIQAENESLDLFAKGLKMLDDYDHELLDKKGNTNKTAILPTVSQYLEVVAQLKSEFASDVFAKPKDHSFESAVTQIGQCFDGKELYPSIEEKAATLLYLVVKNHGFIDGNKRIAAACFLYFLNQNNLLFKNNVAIISNDALATLTLFVATSKTDEMDTVKKLILSILNR